MLDRNLTVQRAMHEQQSADARRRGPWWDRTSAGSGTRACRPLCERCGGTVSHPLPVSTAVLDLLLESDSLVALFGRQLQSARGRDAAAPARARRRWSMGRRSRRPLRSSLARGGQQPDPGAFAVTDDRDALGIDVRTFFEPPDDGAHVLGEVADRGGLRSTAALSVAALVVADRQHAGFGDRSRQLRQRRHALNARRRGRRRPPRQAA